VRCEQRGTWQVAVKRGPEKRKCYGFGLGLKERIPSAVKREETGHEKKSLEKKRGPFIIPARTAYEWRTGGKRSKERSDERPCSLIRKAAQRRSPPLGVEVQGKRGESQKNVTTILPARPGKTFRAKYRRRPREGERCEGPCPGTKVGS